MSILRTTILFLVLAAPRVAAEQSLTSVYGGESAAAPLGMANKWVGGATVVDNARLMDFAAHRDPITQLLSWSWEPAAGPSTVGLRTRVWGTVTSVYSSPVTGEKWFYVDDGSRCVSDFGDVGVLVYSDAAVKEGAYVAVTGVAGVEQSFDSSARLVRVIDAQASDVQVIRPAPGQ